MGQFIDRFNRIWANPEIQKIYREMESQYKLGDEIIRDIVTADDELFHIRMFKNGRTMLGVMVTKDPHNTKFDWIDNERTDLYQIVYPHGTLIS